MNWIGAYLFIVATFLAIAKEEMDMALVLAVIAVAAAILYAGDEIKRSH